MKLQFILVTFLLASSANCELLIAVPASTHAQQQVFEASYIKKPTTSSATILEDATNQIKNSEFLDDTTQTPGDSRSFSMLKEAAGNTVRIGKGDNTRSVTITIKLDGNEVTGIQGQGLDLKDPYAQGSGNSDSLQQTYSLAEVLNRGIKTINPFTSVQPTVPSPSYYETDVPLTESNSFLKSMRNLIQTQILSMMDSSSPKITNFQETRELPYQNYAIFTPMATQPPKQFKQNVADFLTPKFKSQNLNQINPQVQIALPQNNLHPAGSDTTIESTPAENEHPFYTAASAVVKTVSQIPSNLDLMFNDMGRAYRQNLYSLRDKFSDMSSLLPGMISSPTNSKENADPWLDGFGA